MRLWIDCEYNGTGGQLISLALVDEYGDTFYEVLGCEHPVPWVAENVMPLLQKESIPMERFQARLCAWLGRYRVVHVVADWPEDIAYFCRALITGPGTRLDTPALTMEVRRDIDSAASSQPHNALADAQAMRRLQQAQEHDPHRTFMPDTVLP